MLLLLFTCKAFFVFFYLYDTIQHCREITLYFFVITRNITIFAACEIFNWITLI